MGDTNDTIARNRGYDENMQQRKKLVALKLVALKFAPTIIIKWRDE